VQLVLLLNQAERDNDALHMAIIDRKASLNRVHRPVGRGTSATAVETDVAVSND
jgi:hypothetical protein